MQNKQQFVSRRFERDKSQQATTTYFSTNEKLLSLKCTEKYAMHFRRRRIKNEHTKRQHKIAKNSKRFMPSLACYRPRLLNYTYHVTQCLDFE